MGGAFGMIRSAVHQATRGVRGCYHGSDSVNQLAAAAADVVQVRSEGRRFACPPARSLDDGNQNGGCGWCRQPPVLAFRRCLAAVTLLHASFHFFATTTA